MCDQIGIKILSTHTRISQILLAITVLIQVKNLQNVVALTYINGLFTRLIN